MSAVQHRLEGLAARFLEAQLTGNRAAALRVVMDEGVRAGIPVRTLHLDVIRPAQNEIGRLWEENRVSIAQEHLATGIAQLALATLYPHMPREAPTGKRVLLACVEGESHDMGPRICSDFLEMSGFDVRFLGADVPTKDLARMVQEWEPNVVALSITLPVHIRGLRLAVKGVREVSTDTPIVAGGYAFAWDRTLAKDLDVFATGVDVEDLVLAVKRASETETETAA